METKEDGNMMGRDTGVCGDPKIWFPMRGTYQREMKVKSFVIFSLTPRKRTKRDFFAGQTLQGHNYLILLCPKEIFTNDPNPFFRC